MMNIKTKNFAIFSVVALVIAALIVSQVFADSVTTSVTVGNSAPTFTVDAAESSESSSTSPTNEGGTVTIQATGTDSNNESYYMIVCETDAVSTNGGAAPTCPGGAWCTSTLTNSASQASCNIDTTGNSTESNDWYAFLCDDNSSAQACSSSSQGSGGTGSPFAVNHRPTFAAISNNGPQDPGADVTYSTNASTTDADTDGTPDTVKLIVCKTAGISADACDGGGSDTWCESSLVSDDPSCTFTLDNPLADQSYDAYTYLVDNHNFAATGANQGSNESYTVNNVAPVVSAVTLNSGSDITLTEDSTTDVTVTATVTDNNGCAGGEIATVETSVYRSGVGYGLCDTNAEDDNNNCYAQVSCTSTSSCTSAAVDYECTVAVQYHADPTVTSTEYPTENWLNTVNAIDDDAASGNTEVSTGVEMETLVAYDVSASIAYGSLSAGQANDPLDKTVTYTATGNVGLDAEHSGTNMTSGGDSIAVGQQKYALAGSTAYASGVALTSSAVGVSVDVNKTTTSGSPETKDTYWGIEIPVGTPAGSYSGTNTLVAVMSAAGNW